MKRTTLAACIIAACILIVLTIAASTRTLTHGDIYRAGSHWCNWSITATCQRWKANRHKPSYWRECGPNDARSGCLARGLR
jgi:hypothetical protein